MVLMVWIIYADLSGQLPHHVTSREHATEQTYQYRGRA
jgi:hypothetical protein